MLVILDTVMLDIMSYSLFSAGFCHSAFKIVRLVLHADKLLVDYCYLSRLVLKLCFRGVVRSSLADTLELVQPYSRLTFLGSLYE